MPYQTLLFVIVPICASFIIALLARRIKNLSDWIANLAALGLLALSFSYLNKANLEYIIGGFNRPLGICVGIDSMSSFMLVIVNLVVFVVLIYAISYMRAYTDKWKFHALFMLLLAGMNGVIIARDLFNLYIFLEIASISAYALVAFGTESEALEASFKYAIIGSLASIFIILGIGLLYSYTSTLNMSDMAAILALKPKGLLITLVSILFLAGFGIKAALVPFHAWLPDAHSSAPSPVSATLSGVFIKVLGIYALGRIFFTVIGASANLLFVLMLLGLLSMIVGAFLAMAQTDIKRMFAYSSISQIGYIIFAFGIGTPLAIAAGLFHLFNHALFKSLLFLNAGAIEHATGRRALNELGGLNAKLPVSGYTSLIGAMSISGIPPLGGFWSKLLIILASIQAGFLGFAAIAALVSIITLIYYTKFQTFTFFGKLDKSLNQIKEIPFSMKLALIILAVACLVGGLIYLPTLRHFLTDAAQIFSLR